MSYTTRVDPFPSALTTRPSLLPSNEVGFDVTVAILGVYEPVDDVKYDVVEAAHVDVVDDVVIVGVDEAVAAFNCQMVVIAVVDDVLDDVV